MRTQERYTKCMGQGFVQHLVMIHITCIYVVTYPYIAVTPVYGVLLFTNLAVKMHLVPFLTESYCYVITSTKQITTILLYARASKITCTYRVY